MFVCSSWYIIGFGRDEMTRSYETHLIYNGLCEYKFDKSKTKRNSSYFISMLLYRKNLVEYNLPYFKNKICDYFHDIWPIFLSWVHIIVWCTLCASSSDHPPLSQKSGKQKWTITSVTKGIGVAEAINCASSHLFIVANALLSTIETLASINF